MAETFHTTDAGICPVGLHVGQQLQQARVGDEEAPDPMIDRAQHVVDRVPELPHAPDEPGPGRALAGLCHAAHVPFLAWPGEQ
jgi:hypothetical protein